MIAQAKEWADYDSDGHKLLSENRERYIRQSAETKAGKPAELPPRQEEEE